MSQMSHTAACSDSQREDCNCECNGLRHGISNFKHLVIPSQIHPMDGCKSTNWVCKKIETLEEYAFTDPDITVEIVRSAGYFSAETIFEFKSQDNDLSEWSKFFGILESIYQGALDDLTDEVAQNIASEVIDKILETKDDRKDANQQVTLVLRYGHLVCVICAALLKFYGEVGELTDEMAQKLAGNIVDSVVEKIEKDKQIRIKECVKTAVKKVLERALKKMFKALTAKMREIAIPLPWGNELALHIIGVLTCPDPEKHFEVMKYCLKPLVEECLKESIKDQLPEDWRAFLESLSERIEQIEASLSRAQVTVP